MIDRCSYIDIYYKNATKVHSKKDPIRDGCASRVLHIEIQTHLEKKISHTNSKIKITSTSIEDLKLDSIIQKQKTKISNYIKQNKKTNYYEIKSKFEIQNSK